MKKYSTFALLGLMGGILYEIADYFLFINTNLDKLNPDSAWIEMSPVRFLLSMIFAVLGSCLLFFGYLSTWRMLDKKGQIFEKVLGALGVIGVVATVCAHFLLGCIMPLIYKGMALAGCEEKYLMVSDFVNRYTEIVSILALVGIYAPHLASILCLMKGKLEISRWYLAAVLGILVVVTALSEGVFALIGVTGAMGSCESLFEGLLCLIPYCFWKHYESIPKGLD